MTKRKMMMAGMMLMSTALVLGGCERKGAKPSDEHADGHEHGSGSEMGSGATNRVDIPLAVRQNLGITFAKVENRSVTHTLRVPGRFEYLPTARREYHTPVAGRVEVLVKQYARVEAGTVLYRVDSAGWRDVQEQIAIAEARVESMTPLREAHRRHEQGLADKVAIWQDRLKQLEELRVAGGGSAAQFTEARATLNATQAELADVMEKDAELQAQQKQVEAELRSLLAKRAAILRGAGCAEVKGAKTGEALGGELGGELTVCASASGVVEMIGITPGGLAEENRLVVTVVQPEQIRFRARGLQADLGRLREGLAAKVVAPMGGDLAGGEVMSGELRIGLGANADERTVELMVEPTKLAEWARAGVSAQMEITLAGGREELAVPLAAVVRDGARGVIFRRDPANADKVIRMEADLGRSDGRWVEILSGVKEGDEVVVAGNYQLMLATSGSASKGGHFHPDGTFHEEGK